MTPMPPAWAMAMASRPSVTVSMAEEMTGILTAISRVTREADVGLGRQHVGGAGHQQHVVEGQRHGALVQDGPLRHARSPRRVRLAEIGRTRASCPRHAARSAARVMESLQGSS